MKKKWKFDFINNGKEFTFPEIGIDADVELNLELLMLQDKIATEMSKQLGIDVEHIPDNHPKKEFYKTIWSIKFNLEIAYFMLKKVDPNVKKSQVSKLGGKVLAEMVLDIFTPESDDKKDFHKAT